MGRALHREVPQLRSRGQGKLVALVSQLVEQRVAGPLQQGGPSDEGNNVEPGRAGDAARRGVQRQGRQEPSAAPRDRVCEAVDAVSDEEPPRIGGGAVCAGAAGGAAGLGARADRGDRRGPGAVGDQHRRAAGVPAPRRAGQGRAGRAGHGAGDVEAVPLEPGLAGPGAAVRITARCWGSRMVCTTRPTRTTGCSWG
jgi:hypothetical protein